MNQVEMLQGQVAALSRRLEEHEKLFRLVQVAGADPLEAGRVALEIGFSVDIIHIKRSQERPRLARELKARGWSATRIARAFGVSERAVMRWVRAARATGAPQLKQVGRAATDEKGQGRDSKPQ